MEKGIVYLFAILSVVCSSTAQIVLKSAAVDILPQTNLINTQNWFHGILSIFLNINLIVGVFLQILALLLWLKVLSVLPASIAYPLISFGFVYVFLFDYFRGNIEVTGLMILGLLTILAGILIISIASGKTS